MTAKIYETYDYDKFTLHFLNRSIKKINTLEKSMRKIGFLDAYPMYCVNDGKKLKIKDGHHRFTAATNLGIAVKYVVLKDLISMFDLQKTTRVWNLEDWLYAYVQVKKPAYAMVEGFCRRTGIGIGQSISLLAGELASSSNKAKMFKSGNYEVKNEEFAWAVADIILHLKGVGVSWATNNLLVSAISKLILIPELDVSLFKKKLKTYKGLIEKQPNVISFIDMFEKIYNKRNQNSMPLGFFADREAKKRQVQIVKNRA